MDILSTKLTSKYLQPVIDDASSEDEDDQSQPLFTIDTRPDNSSPNDEPQPSPSQASNQITKTGPSLQTGLDIQDPLDKDPNELDRFINSHAEADRIYKEQCIINKDLSYDVSAYRTSRRQRKKQNKAEKEKDAGPNWFNMKSVELTEEVKNDLQVLQMRDALDRKRFYTRGSSTTKVPKHFQVGTVVGTSADYYNTLTAKQRKRTLVDELMADAEQRSWSKRKYAEIITKHPYYQRKQRRQSRKNDPKLQNRKKEQREKRMSWKLDRKGNEGD